MCVFFFCARTRRGGELQQSERGQRLQFLISRCDAASYFFFFFVADRGGAEHTSEVYNGDDEQGVKLSRR